MHLILDFEVFLEKLKQVNYIRSRYFGHLYVSVMHMGLIKRHQWIYLYWRNGQGDTDKMITDKTTRSTRFFAICFGTIAPNQVVVTYITHRSVCNRDQES